LVGFFLSCYFVGNQILWTIIAARVADIAQSAIPTLAARICATYLDLGTNPRFWSILNRISSSKEIPMIVFGMLRVLTTFLILTVFDRK